MSAPTLPRDFSILQQRRRVEERLRHALHDADHHWRPLQVAVNAAHEAWLADPSSSNLRTWTDARITLDTWWTTSSAMLAIQTLEEERDALELPDDDAHADREAFVGFEAREDQRLSVALQRVQANRRARAGQAQQTDLRNKEAALRALLVSSLASEAQALPEATPTLVSDAVEEAWRDLKAARSSNDIPALPSTAACVGLIESEWQRVRAQAESVTRPAWLSMLHATERSAPVADVGANDVESDGTREEAPVLSTNLLDPSWFDSVELLPWLARIADGLTFQSRDILENLSFVAPALAPLGATTVSLPHEDSRPRLWVPAGWLDTPDHLQDLIEALGEALARKYQPHHTPTFMPSSMHQVQDRTVGLFLGMLLHNPEFYRIYLEVPVMEFTALQRPLRQRAHQSYVRRLRHVLALSELFEDLAQPDDNRTLQEHWTDLWKTHTRPPVAAGEEQRAFAVTLLHFLDAPHRPSVEVVSLLAAAQLHTALEVDGQEPTVDGLYAGAALCRHWISPGEETPWPALLESLTGQSLTPEAFQRLFLRA